MKPPALVLFDLGNVIVNVDHRAVAARFAEVSNKLEFRDPAVLFSTIMRESASLLRAFDMGEITAEIFFDRLKSTCHLDLNFEDFVQIWNSGFSENQEVSNIIRRLNREVRLFLLSNTNSLHFEYLRSKCSVIQSMEQVILSYRLGCMKPSAEIFHHALQQAGVPAESVWYVDDVPEFVDAARKLGIHSIQFTSARQLSSEFQDLLKGNA